MIRRYFTISILTLAQLLFLGHSIIPHQHEEHHSHQHESHGNHDHDDSHSDKGGFIHHFFDFNHADNSNDFLKKITRSTVEKENLPFISPTQESVFKTLSKFFIQQKAPPENCLFNSFYVFLPSGRRGPPNTIA